MKDTGIERHKAGVYKIVNKVNGNMYVGSSVNVYNRRYTHATKLNRKTHSNKHLQSAYHKYGKDNFVFEVLEYTDDITSVEQHYIDTLHPHYNKRLVAQNNIGLKVSTQTRNKISATLKLKYKEGMETYRQQHAWRTVEQYDLQGNLVNRFKNAAEADKFLQVTPGDICKAVKASSKYRHGFQWKYADSSKLISKSCNLGTRGRAVIVKDLRTGSIQRFATLASCAKFFDTHRGSLQKVVKKSNPIYKTYYYIQYQDLYKLCELLGTPEEDNQQPSASVMM